MRIWISGTIIGYVSVTSLKDSVLLCSGVYLQTFVFYDCALFNILFFHVVEHVYVLRWIYDGKVSL